MSGKRPMLQTALENNRYHNFQVKGNLKEVGSRRKYANGALTYSTPTFISALPSSCNFSIVPQCYISFFVFVLLYTFVYLDHHLSVKCS